MSYTLATKLFGEIKVSLEEGFFDDVEDATNNRSFHLDIFDEVTEEKDFLKIGKLLDAYHELDQQAKRFLLQEYQKNNPDVHIYYDTYKEELQEELDRAFAPDEQSIEHLINKTEIASIWFNLEDEDILATFDYRLLADHGDAILVVRFDDQKRIVDLYLEE
ncbi:hypothetical protein BAU15_02735 [Enterococcus sp. JM4C]|uniref:DUF2004 domain-containing protein n=1 Tax=Candidatus Enterococcus huntleyi TaxID=1857217 RepID=UPI00137B01D8|nr:DUF2004 domain-containing protein [Enterococcus sp. JM4C]KAF1299577.1 hypothetical protein BAU15_02735 [Enterococcus sp. JM4C]